MSNWEGDKWEGIDYSMNNTYSLKDVTITMYSQFAEGDRDKRSPIATGWCLSGDWYVAANKGDLVFCHIDSRDKPSRYSMEEVAKMYATQSIQRIRGYELKYKEELLQYMREFLNDCLQEMLDE